jgi:hypothetical protein
MGKGFMSLKAIFMSFLEEDPVSRDQCCASL